MSHAKSFAATNDDFQAVFKGLNLKKNMKRPCIKLSAHREMIIPCMVSSPETSSGQAIWQKPKIIII
ncbi:hypothetical protein BZG01_20460 [Labilibaculum manganireducens]|uniref:Uncharacterized protein n=1 Tax=Labilibaculum manganireducens TaxID=1940525 RepID=A0A2N3HRQ2_9BACT|nr:hypothetical protein BZG01_20460 [Labilibaculum manganireducens]